MDSVQQIYATDFRQSFSNSPEPSKAMVYNLMKKFRTTGLQFHMKRTCVKRVFTEMMLDEIGNRLKKTL